MPEPTLLAELTTLRLGGPAGRLVVAGTEVELLAEVGRADETGQPLLLVAGGSNLVVGDDGFEGTVVHVATRGMQAEPDTDEPACGGVRLRVAAGEPWDDVVALAVRRGWAGIEALSGIPGSTGAVPVQNVGAYGQEVSHTIATVRTWDRVERRQRTFAGGECGFGYRTSRFKREPGRYVVLEVGFDLLVADLSGPLRYGELARRLALPDGGRAPLADVRREVLALRAGKGMVLDEVDPDTWSAGSFFTNPVLSEADADRLPGDAPRWPGSDGVKTSAAWLIQQAGYDRGFALTGSRAAVSGKHTLALTNRGGASSAELLDLAREIRDGVRARFGVELVPEPVLVGCAL